MIEHEGESKLLEERMQKARTVPGTQRLHFNPLSTEIVKVQQYSTSPICRVERVVLKDATLCTPPPTCIAIGYVTVAYYSSCWLWYVLGVNELEGGVKVKFLHPCIPLSSFVYPNQEDIMDMDPSDILTQVAHTQQQAELTHYVGKKS